MLKKESALALVLLFFFAVSGAIAFSDVPPDHPERLAIDYLANTHVLSGYPDDTFRPDDTINRAEAVKVILGAGDVGPRDLAALPDAPKIPPFIDVHPDDWFFPYVHQAYALGVAEGDDRGTVFAPARSVNLAEFIKMLFKAHQVSAQSTTVYADLPKGAWFSPLLAYAADLGLITPDVQKRLRPDRWISRAEVARILYLFRILQQGRSSDFLLEQTQRAFSQIEVYMQAGRVDEARLTAELAGDLTAQAMKNDPADPFATAMRKLSEGYTLLIQAFVAASLQDTTHIQALTDQVISMATEAWAADHDVQPLARHLKDRAREILGH